MKKISPVFTIKTLCVAICSIGFLTACNSGGGGSSSSKGLNSGGGQPTVTPAPTITPIPTPTVDPTAEPSPQPSVTPDPIATPVPVPTPTATPVVNPTVSPQPIPSTIPTPNPQPSSNPVPNPVPSTNPTTPVPVPTPSASPAPQPSPTPVIDCGNPATSSQAISCMVSAFNTQKAAVVAQADAVYQYNYDLGYQSMTTSVTTGQRLWSAPNYAEQYIASIYPDVLNLKSQLLQKEFSQLPQTFAKYQQDRQTLIANPKAHDFATYLVKEQEQLIGKIAKVSGDAPKAQVYAQVNYMAYGVPAGLYGLYDFLSSSAPQYINYAVNDFNQGDCETAVASFQSKFATTVANNKIIADILAQGAPNSALRQIVPFVNKDINLYVLDGIDVLSAFTQGKVVVGNQYAPYDVCNYNAFQQVAGNTSNPNPYLVELNMIVNQTAKTTGYPAQNIYYLMTAFSSAGLAQMLENYANSNLAPTIWQTN